MPTVKWFPSSFLGTALREQGKLVEAEAAGRKAIALDPNDGNFHEWLGITLGRQGKLAEAEAAFRQAIALLEPDGAARNYANLAVTFERQGKRAEEVAAYRKAVALKPDFAMAHEMLGARLLNLGKLAEAEEACRKAIALKPDNAYAHCWLGLAMRAQGHLAEALKELRLGHNLGSKGSSWDQPSAQWVKECERLADLDAKLPAFLKGEANPADPAERLALAQLCGNRSKRLYTAAVRWYAEAFAADSTLAEDPRYDHGGHRFDAACAAAQAGCGEGQDAAALDEKERGRLRRQALDWLQNDLSAWRRLLEQAKAGPGWRVILQHWCDNPDLAGVRDPEALAKLPPAEQEAWRSLWAEVAQLLKRAKTEK